MSSPKYEMQKLSNRDEHDESHTEESKSIDVNIDDVDIDGVDDEEDGYPSTPTTEKDPISDVDFNEDQWLPCIPKFSLTAATFLFAAIGIAVGLAIALTGPQTITKEIVTKTTTNYYNISGQDLRNETIKNIYKVEIIDGEPIYFYTISENTTDFIDIPIEQLSEDWKTLLEFPGKIWVNALKLLVLPLIILMMVLLPSRVDQIGFIGKLAVPLYLFTSTMAAIQGTIWVWVLEPGKYGSQPSIEGAELATNDVTELETVLNIFFNAVPDNIITAMQQLTILGVIVFFICIGILLRRESVPDVERDAVLNVTKAILRCCMYAIVWVIWFTPIGMASLVCVKIATTENLSGLVAALGFYVLTVVIGHSIHVFGFYPLTFFATTRGNGWLWFWKIRDAPLLAFATSSSTATLPKSLVVAEAAGVRKSIYQFILPLGSAINMDGTALGFPIMIALIAQLNDVSLDFGKIIIVLILAVIISIGTAPIPNVGMVYLTMLFEAAGIGQYAGEGIATLFVLDWFVDRVETAVNVTSDQYVAKITDVIDLKRQKRKGFKSEKKNKCCRCVTANKQNHGNEYEQPQQQSEMM